MTEDKSLAARSRGRGVFPHEYADHLLSPWRKLLMPPWLLVRRLGLSPTDHVLEIGPGPGYFSLSVAKRLQHGRLVLFDLQPEMLERAASRLRAAGLDNFEAQEGSAEALPFTEGSFDVVVLVAVLGEVADPAEPIEEQTRVLVQAMGEARRVLKPGGRLSITEVPGDPDFLPEERIQELADRVGLVRERRFGVRRFYTLNLRKPESHTA